MVGSELVVYTRTAASDFRLFLNVAPESLHGDREVFEAVSDLVDRAYDVHGGIHAAIIRDDACICGVAGQPSGAASDLSSIGGRRNIAFVGLFFDNRDSAILPSDEVLWGLYKEHVVPVWETPSSEISGPVPTTVEVPEDCDTFSGWDPRAVVSVTGCVEVVEFENNPVTERVHIQEKRESGSDTGFGSFRNRIKFPDTSSQKPRHDRMRREPMSDPGMIIAERMARSVFGKDISDASQVKAGDYRPDFVSKDGNVEIEVSMDLAKRNDDEKRAQIRSGLVGGFMLRKTIGKTFKQLASAREHEMVAQRLHETSQRRRFVLYPVDTGTFDSMNIDDLGKTLEEFDFNRYGVDGVVIKVIPSTVRNQDGGCRVYYQDEGRMDRNRFKSPETEFIRIGTPRKRVI